MVEKSLFRNETIKLEEGDALFLSLGNLEGSDLSMSTLNHIITKSAVTLTASTTSKIILIKSQQIQEIKEDAKKQLLADTHAFSINAFKVVKLVGSGSYGKVFLCVNENNNHT